MKRYKNLGRKSGIEAYEIGPGYIWIKWPEAWCYLYTSGILGAEAIQEMQTRAEAGEGLGTFVNQNVRARYAAKALRPYKPSPAEVNRTSRPN